MIFSLVVATYGRTEELTELLVSLNNQTFDSNLFEVIIIDQNDHAELDEILKPFDDLNIIHMKSAVKGISVNRNIGINIAKGKYLAFPDDDCTYYPDTLENAFSHLSHSGRAMVLGAIFDRATQKPIIKRWPKHTANVTEWNLQRFSTSISIFCKNSSIRFREDLGAGTSNGSCEDLDYIYNFIQHFGEALYIPSIEVWHPEQPISEIPLSKVESYGRGFGHFCKINRKHPSVLVMLSIVLAYHAIQLIKEIFFLHPSAAQKRLAAIKSRAISFFS